MQPIRIQILRHRSNRDTSPFRCRTNASSRFSSVAYSMAARRYDHRTTIFSPEGRLYQVEYAMEAINNAGTAIGALATNGIVLASEKKISSKVYLFLFLIEIFVLAFGHDGGRRPP